MHRHEILIHGTEESKTGLYAIVASAATAAVLWTLTIPNFVEHEFQTTHSRTEYGGTKQTNCVITGSSNLTDDLTEITIKGPVADAPLRFSDCYFYPNTTLYVRLPVSAYYGVMAVADHDQVFTTKPAAEEFFID